MNGKKNGIVKEYFYNKLIFEGEYLNGEKNGKGKEYYNNKNLLFEGDYLNGKRWNGEGKEFNKKGIFKYNVVYLNGIISSYSH